MSSSSPKNSSPSPPIKSTFPTLPQVPTTLEQTHHYPSFFPHSTSNPSVPHISLIPETKSEPSYPPPRNVFQTSPVPPVSMPPPTYHSHLTTAPPNALLSHRHNTIPSKLYENSQPSQHYSIPSGPITAPPQLPPPHTRILSSPEYPDSLLSRIAHLEHCVRNSPCLQEILTEMSQRTAHVASGVDIDSKIHFAGRNTHENTIASYGFPKSDVDADYCLEDTPGLSHENFNLLKDTLNSHLQRSRRCAEEMIKDLETSLAPQISFRALPAAEMERRIQFIVNKFCEARQQILHKFRGYVRNRRWIENVATRQRRGCLSHRQNNILRLWLFSHFNNPYPDNKDKKKLIRETALSITQINNWLINARSRVWKPTVEIMSGERIRKEMKKKEEALATGKVRDWELAEFSIVPPSGNVLGKLESSCGNDISPNSITSVPINMTPGAQTAVRNTCLGSGTVANVMHGSAGAITEGGASVVPDIGPEAGQQVEGLSDVGGNWLVPQTFGALEFNPDVNHQHG